ncbi:MAG: cupin domain-containing protein [Gemmatimonadales bacterium]
MTEPAPPRLAAPAAFEAGRPERYTGNVKVARILRAGDDSVRVYEVCFAPGSRTVWHAHAGEQLLVILSGRCVVQCVDTPPRHLAPGGSIRVPPGVRHWHGALPEGPASHLALNANGPTDWGRAVSDAEFSAAVQVMD